MLKHLRRSVIAVLLVANVEARAETCTPQELMAKVSTLTQLLERQMQLPLAMRRTMVARMQNAMARHPAGPIDYQGVCEAYDDLLAQLRR